MKSELYFNFPINLLQGIFLPIRNFGYKSITEVMDDIMSYCLYMYILNKKNANEGIEGFQKDYKLQLGNAKKSLENGKELIESIPKNNPITGISHSMLFDFYKHSKSEFEVIQLLAFLGIKSILGTKPAQKTNIRLVLNRMSGNTSFDSKESIEKDSIPDKIIKYALEYHWKKLISTLEMHWNLKYYSRYLKGFYVSFDLSLKELIIECEKNRDTNKLRDFRAEKSKEIAKILKENLHDH